VITHLRNQFIQIALKIKTKHWLWVILLVGIVAGLSWSYFSPRFQNPGPPAMPVEVSSVRSGTFVRTLKTVGTLKAYQSVTLQSEVAGKISHIFYTDGQSIEPNTPLITLDDAIQKAQLSEALAKLTLGQAEYKRSHTLLQKQAVSVNECDTAYAKLKVNEALVDHAKANLSKMTLSAPFKGVIGITKVNVGNFITPGQTIVDIVQLDPIFADFHIPEVYLKDIYINQPIHFYSQAFPKESIRGVITAINPNIDPISHSIYIRSQIPNTQHLLRPGLFVTADIVLETRPNTLFVPEEALMPQSDKQYVYRVVDNKAVLTEVISGERQNHEIVIKNGLNPTDSVITAGQIKIQPGGAVYPIPTEPNPSSPEQSHAEKKIAEGKS